MKENASSRPRASLLRSAEYDQKDREQHIRSTGKRAYNFQRMMKNRTRRSRSPGAVLIFVYSFFFFGCAFLLFSIRSQKGMHRVVVLGFRRTIFGRFCGWEGGRCIAWSDDCAPGQRFTLGQIYVFIHASTHERRYVADGSVGHNSFSTL